MGLLTRTYNDNTITLIFSGNLDADGSQSALPQLDKVIANPKFNEIEVDLTNVTFLDSSGVGAIVYLYKRLIAKERSMRIENVSGQPLEIFNLLRIGNAIPINSKQLKQTSQAA